MKILLGIVLSMVLIILAGISIQGNHFSLDFFIGGVVGLLISHVILIGVNG